MPIEDADPNKFPEELVEGTAGVDEPNKFVPEPLDGSKFDEEPEPNKFVEEEFGVPVDNEEAEPKPPNAGAAGAVASPPNSFVPLAELPKRPVGFASVTFGGAPKLNAGAADAVPELFDCPNMGLAVPLLPKVKVEGAEEIAVPAVEVAEEPNKFVPEVEVWGNDGTDAEAPNKLIDFIVESAVVELVKEPKLGRVAADVVVTVETGAKEGNEGAVEVAV